MTPACDAIQPLLTLRAAGALPPEEAAAVEAHLLACPACRAEAERDAEVLGLAALPPVALDEQAALADLPARTLRELRVRSARRLRARKALTVMAIAAVALLALASPALLRGRAPAGAGPTAAPAWHEPDLAALWDQSGVVYAAADTAQRGDAADDTLAVLDADDD